MEHQEVGVKRAQSIITVAARVAGIGVKKLKSDSRRREIVDIRRMCFKLIREKLNLPTPVIGAIFNRDHATILHNLNQHDDLCSYEKEYKTLYDTLKIAIGIKSDLGNEETLFIERLVHRVEFHEQENKNLNVKITKIETLIQE